MIQQPITLQKRLLSQSVTNIATTITNLPVDVVSSIMETVAKSQDGSRHLAQSMAICKHFLEASDSDVIFRAASFQNVKTLNRSHLFQNTNGILSKCAKAGNPRAVHLLAQVILASSSQLLKFKTIKKANLKYFRGYKPKYQNGRRGPPQKDYLVASFVSHFTPAQGSHPIPNFNSLRMSFHWEFVRAFILNCTTNEFQHMFTCLEDYVKLFASRSNYVSFFLKRVRVMGEVSFALNHKADEPDIVSWYHLEEAFEFFQAKALKLFDFITPNLL